MINIGHGIDSPNEDILVHCVSPLVKKPGYWKSHDNPDVDYKNKLVHPIAILRIIKRITSTLRREKMENWWWQYGVPGGKVVEADKAKTAPYSEVCLPGDEKLPGGYTLAITLTDAEPPINRLQEQLLRVNGMPETNKRWTGKLSLPAVKF
jgi:hypothetical protein